MKRANPNSEHFPIAIGYWRDDDQSSLPNPFDFVNTNVPLDLRNAIAKYLDNGKRFIPFLGYSWCRFKCGIEDHEMGASCFTDGVYVWPEGLSHYIRIHDVWLPDVFVNHVLENPNKDCELVDLSKLDLHDYSWWKQQKSE